MKLLDCPTRLVLFSLATVLIALAAPVAAGADDQDAVRVYPAPAGEPLSNQFTVNAGGQPVPIYLAKVWAMSPQLRIQADKVHFTDSDFAETSFASFDLRGPAPITVTCAGTIETVKILPSSSGIVPKVLGNTITFTLSKPGQFVVEVNGDWAHALQIFADPWENDAPNPKDPRVIYYGPGIHDIGSVTVASGQTVYIAGGAVIYSTIFKTPGGPKGAAFVLKGDNIVLRGRGIIDASRSPHFSSNLIYVEGRNITVEGVTLRDSTEWNLPIVGSDSVTVKNIKVFGWRRNADAIDVNGCRNVDISNCYLRTDDDLVTIKSKIPEKGETRNVTVSHCVLWNEFAQALIVGGEMRRTVDNIHFSDCDVIHDFGRTWLLHVAQCDSAHVGNIIFESIRIEQCQRLIGLHIEHSMYSRDPERGQIENVTFRNITSTVPERDPLALVTVNGFDAGHEIHGVQFDHVVVAGRPLNMNDVKTNQFANSVTVTP